MARKARNRQAGTREPNGRLSRRKDEAEKRLEGQIASRFKDLEREERATIAPGIEARQRVHGLPFDQAASPMAGTFIGRLCMGKEISAVQYEAAMLYAEDCRNYSIARQSPREPGAVDLNATKGVDNYENVDRARRAVVRIEGDKVNRIPGANEAIQAAQNELRGNGALFAALYEIVLRDREVYHLVGDCRLGLSALARHYGLTAATRKEAA